MRSKGFLRQSARGRYGNFIRSGKYVAKKELQIYLEMNEPEMDTVDRKKKIYEEE